MKLCLLTGEVSGKVGLGAVTEEVGTAGFPMKGFGFFKEAETKPQKGSPESGGIILSTSTAVQGEAIGRGGDCGKAERGNLYAASPAGNAGLAGV